MGRTYTYAGNETVASALAGRLAEAGFSRVKGVDDADFVVTYCTTATALEDVYFDEDGFVQSARPGTVLVDLSPSTPSFARELNAVATVSDLASVEAPLVVDDITAAHAFSDAANLACFAAGDEKALEQARPLLEAVAKSVQLTGGPGSAQLARAAYSLQMSAQIASAIEADALYRAVHRSSVSFERAPERAGALTPQAEHVLSAVNEGCFDGDYTVEMLMAELSSALMAADDVDLILPQAEATQHLLELLAVIGGADKAPAALALVYGEEAACAENGLDWERAEQAYGGSEGFDGELDDYADYDGFEDEDGDRGGFSGGFSYSAN